MHQAAHTFPDCTTKTLEELRKPKLDAWNRNKENSRAWLALNMMTEARAGFRAFNEGTEDTGREVDFIILRRALAANAKWDDELTENILPGAAKHRSLSKAGPGQTVRRRRQGDWESVMSAPSRVWIEAEGKLLRLRLSGQKRTSSMRR